MAKYLGISFIELSANPPWFNQIAALRMREEAEYESYKAKQAEK